MGDRFSQVAVLALLLELTGSGLAVGILMGMRVLPYLILSPVAGKFADIWDRRKMMMVTDIARVPFAFSFLFVQSQDDLWILYSSMFVLACGEAIYQPVRKSSIGVLVEEQHYAKVNGFEQVVIGIVLIIGSITGGLVAFLIGKDVAFILNGCTFMAAASLIYPLKFKRQKSQQSPAIPVQKPRAKLDPMVLFIVVILGVSAGLDGLFNILISYYGAETFNLGELGIGLLYGALGIGLVMSFFISKQVKGKMLLIGIITIGMEGVLQMLASQASVIWAAALAFTGISLFGGVGAACFDTLVMARTPKSDQGRVFGFIESLTNVVIGLAMFGSGWLLDSFAARQVGFIGGIAAIGSMVLFIVLYSFYFHKIIENSRKMVKKYEKRSIKHTEE
ncbi:MFS transporter [Halobacillus naozhouensis]|uniref:MFS transporter n=1 Tax=Halobacillus naozhouensis TaxID=554880 RepID=A0ABY8J411_9BACI|nr:MFS transporter [Halobacillus naozhouensis]WFT76339.1 MFS transporter [Halobacillus naozhouensis]